MSNPRYSIIPGAAVFDERVSPMDLRVLCALGTYTDANGWCFPRQKTLLERLGIARSTLALALKRLSEWGYIEVRAIVTKRGKEGNEYRVNTNPKDKQSPMSDGPDIGRKKRTESPMSDGPDIRADVRWAGHPMSDVSDIPYKGTTPTERPHVSESSNDDSESLAQTASPSGPVADLLGSKPAQAAKPPKAKRSAGYTDDFEAFWKSWPRPIRQNSDKRASAVRWAAALKRWDAKTLMGAAKVYLANTKVSDDEPGPWKPRTCQAQVFLNGKLDAAVEAFSEKGGDDIPESVKLQFFEFTGKWRDTWGPRPSTPPRGR